MLGGCRGGRCSPGITHDCDRLRVNVSPRGDEWNNFHRAQTQRAPRCRGLGSKSGDSDKNNCSDYSWYTSRSRYSCGVHPYPTTNAPRPTHLYFIFNSATRVKSLASLCLQAAETKISHCHREKDKPNRAANLLPASLAGWLADWLADWLSG